MLGRFFVTALAVMAFVPRAVSAADLPGKVIIKVTIEGTGEPVPGAKVHANLGIVQAEEEKSFPPERLTDANGRFELAVPWGNVRMGAPMSPTGFWPVTNKVFGINQLQQFVVTRQQPVVEKNFTVKKGTLWSLKMLSTSGLPLADAEVHAYRSSDQSQSALTTDAEGRGQLTLPVDGGAISVGFFLRQRSITPRQHAHVEIETDFDPRSVESQSATAEGKKVELTDKKGRKAVWEGCSVALKNGEAELLFAADYVPLLTDGGGIEGMVANSEGNPILGAAIWCQSAGVPLSESRGFTDAEGKFRFRGILKPGQPSLPAGFRLIVTKEGFAGTESKHFFTPSADGTQCLDKPLILQRGYSVPLRILDEHQQPVEGAWVSHYEGSVQIAKSDSVDTAHCTIYL
jgi:hypothetical protein